MRIGIIGAGHAGVEAARQASSRGAQAVQTDRGIVLDERLQTSAPGVFACGDITQRDAAPTATVLPAYQQGRGAGDNAVASLQGERLAYVAEPVAPLSFKHGDVQLHAIGATTAGGLEEKVLSDDGQAVYRSVLLEQDGTIRGVQMIGSHEGLRELADSLGRPWKEAPMRDYASGTPNPTG